MYDRKPKEEGLYQNIWPINLFLFCGTGVKLVQDESDISI